MKHRVTFTRPGRVVTGASTQLAIPDIAAARCEGGVFAVRVRIAKVFTEGLGCDAGRDLAETKSASLWLLVSASRCFPIHSRTNLPYLLPESIKAADRTK